jgi:hypothetical protein
MTKQTTRLCLLSAAFLLAASLAHAQILAIPQVVDGGAWLTTIAFTNISANPETVNLRFLQETSGGNTTGWNLDFAEMSSVQIQQQGIAVAGGSTLILHSLGTAANTTIGWGQMSEQDGAGFVVAYAIFTQRIPGRTDQDGTAPSISAVSRILVPFDNTNGATTTMAIANSTSASENINVGIRIGAGNGIQLPGFVLPANGHMAFPFTSQYTLTAGQSGLAEFYTPSGGFSIVALRFQTGAFSTAPVYSVQGLPIIASSVPPAGN